MATKDEMQLIGLRLTELAVGQKATQVTLSNVKEDLDALKHSVIGNGKPGLITRVDRLEQTEAFKTKLIWILFGSLVSAVGSIAVFFLQKHFS